MAKAQPDRGARRRPRPVEPKAQRSAAPAQTWVVPALAVAFLLSGAAGLMHEVVWARLLSLVFGATALAISTVLAAYMGGLALGSYWIGRRSDRFADGRRTYALLEVAIGASAFAVPVLLTLVEPLYGWVWRQTHASFATFSVLRLVLAGAILLGPTVLMGATLPVLADYCAGLQGRRVAPQWLYTMNLVGALLGVAAAGFLLMPRLGVWGTILVATALNIGVGLGVLLMPRLAARAPAIVTAPEAAPLRPSALVWVAAFCSGLVSMAMQVAWTRILALIVGSTTYAFSSVLVVFLLALGAGSALASRRAARLVHVGTELAVAYGLLALTMLCAVFAVNRLPYWYLQLSMLWKPETIGGVVGVQIAILCSVLIIPVVCAGAILPLAIIAVTPPDARGTGPAVGRVYAINTLGAIAGALLGGFVLVPRLGTQVTIVAVCVLCGVLACVFAAWARRPGWLAPAAVAALVLVGVGVAARPTWDFNELHSGVFEPGRLRWTPGYPLTLEGEEVLYHREGPTASVLVGKRPSGYRNLIINARANASDSPGDMRTQVLFAHVPLLLAPRAKDVFILGWGSGVTVGSALLWPDIRLTAVEIEPAVVESSRFFEHVNNQPFRHGDRLRLLEDDARHILQADESTYDVIISEPSHPWVSGVANLFTRDYYRIVSRRLRPEGVFVQWLQTYQISTDSFRSILAALQSVFPEVLVFRPLQSTDTLLVGTHQSLPLDLEEIGRRWQPEAVRADLGRVGLKRPEDLLANFYLSPDTVRRMVRKGTINTDNNMYVELRGPSEYVQQGETSAVIVEVLRRIASPVETVLAHPEQLLTDKERLAAYVEALEANERTTSPYAEHLATLR
jgi:spermidine synthase